MRRIVLTAVAVCGLAAVGGAARAQSLVGTTVTGTLEFPGVIPPTTNFYDPTNSVFDGVPIGYDDFNANGPTVTIDGNPTFGYADGYSFITAAFTVNTLTLTEDVDYMASDPDAGSNPWTQTFTDTALIGATFSTANDGFGLASASLTGDVITIGWNGEPDGTPDADYSAQFDITTALPVPEPATLGVLAIALIGLAAARRNRPA
jgi:hypothetical protein